jgi:hypothetical protein
MRVRSNHPGLESALNHIVDRLDQIEALASREIHVGPGLRSMHSDPSTLLLQAKARGGGGGDCRKWASRIVTKDKKRFLVISSGTINGVRPVNMNKEVAIDDDEAYIYLKCSSTEDSLSATIVTDPEGTLSNSVDAEGAPPSEFYAYLGFISGNTIVIDVCYSLSALPIETRRTGKEPEGPGAEPFDRWYRWDVRELKD